MIRVNPLGYSEIELSIGEYIHANQGSLPEYLIIHPDTKMDIVLSSTRMISYKIVNLEDIMGISVLRSVDVEEGFLIIC